MKKLLLAIVILTQVGCGVRYIGPGAADRDYSDASQDTAYEADVRVWLAEDIRRVTQKIDDINNMFDAGKITYGEAKILLDRAHTEQDTRIERARERFPH